MSFPGRAPKRLRLKVFQGIVKEEGPKALFLSSCVARVYRQRRIMRSEVLYFAQLTGLMNSSLSGASKIVDAMCSAASLPEYAHQHCCEPSQMPTS